GHGDTAGSIALPPGGKLLASASRDGEVIEWDLASRKIVRRIPVGAPLLSIAYSSDGRLFAASTSQGVIRIWRTPSWEPLNKIGLLAPPDRGGFLRGGAWIVVCDWSGTVHFCPTEGEEVAPGRAITSGTALRAWSAHRGQIFALVALRNSQELITA